MTYPTKKRRGLLRTTLTGIALLALSSICGFFTSRYVEHAVLVPLLKYTIGIVGIVWLFSLTVYNKLSDVTDLSGLDYQQHRNIESEISSRLQWFWLRAIFIGLLAIAIYVPTILSDAKIVTPDWVIGVAFGAVSLALFSLRRLWSELEEIRQLKSHVKEIERREQERTNTVKTLKEGLQNNWEPDTNLDGFRKNEPKE